MSSFLQSFTSVVLGTGGKGGGDLGIPGIKVNELKSPALASIHQATAIKDYRRRTASSCENIAKLAGARTGQAYMHGQVTKHEIALIKAGVKAYQADAKKQIAIIGANSAVAQTRSQVAMTAATAQFDMSMLVGNTQAAVGVLTGAQDRARQVFS